MIIRKDEPETIAENDGEKNRWQARRVSDAGGLTQFGAYVHTLQPGWRSADRHWHENEDELLFMLEGEAVVVEEEGEYVLGPGDAACWRAGTANGHHVFNRSDAPCTYLILGTRVERDVVHYPDLGQTLTIDGKQWRILRDADGVLLKEGTEP